MPDVELEARGLDEVDEDAPRFKRIVAVLVVLITLFGACVAYLQTVESNKEDVAARDAQREQITGLGSQVEASSGFASDLGIASGVDTQIELQALNAGRVNATAGDPDSDVHLADSARYGASAAAIAGLTPVDPADPTTADAAAAIGNEETDAARLRAAARADEANDRGSKADSYVAVLTVLAVALFLLGLSLTVQGRSRRILALPGVAIAVACVVWTGWIASRPVSLVSDTAARLAAEGQTLVNSGDVEGAIEAFDEAIEDSPDFGAAFARRGEAKFLEGSAQIAESSFISIADEAAVEAAVEDLERAIELGQDTDPVTLADAGFFTFLLEDFGRSAELSRQALEVNDQSPTAWFNLGVAEIAQDNADAAEEAYREGIDLVLHTPDEGTAQLVMAGARTDLMVLRDLLDDDELDDVAGLLEDAESALAEADLALRPCLAEGGDCTGADIGGGAEVTDGTFTRNGGVVFADLSTTGIEPGTPVAATWYIRTDPDQPLQQTAFGLESVLVGDDGLVSTATVADDTGCPVAGEYVVRLVGGGRVIGEATGTIEPSPLGAVFTFFADRLEGIEVCVPDGFETQRADVSALDAFTGFIGDTIGIGVNTTPGNEAVESDDLVEQQIVAAFVGGTPDTVETRAVTLNGLDLRGQFVGLEGFAVSGLSDGDPVAAAFAFGPGGTSHTLLLTGSDDPALLDEIIGLVTFTDLAG